MQRGSPARLPLWLIIATALSALVGVRVLSSHLAVKSTELTSVQSPGGLGDAVLLDIPRDARGTHSAAVCLRVSSVNRSTPCTSVAYISGVPDNADHLGISLAWRSATELEIRYRGAAAAYLYYPTFLWRRTARATIFSNARTFSSVHTTLVRVQ